MGKRGPKKKPTSLRILEGNPGRLPINDCEITIDLPPVMPSAVGMDGHAEAEWRRLIAAMPPGIYNALDSALIAQYALAWSMMVRAQQEIDERGLMVDSEKYSKDGELIGTERDVNPAVKAWKLASETLLKTGDRLGLNPGVRASLRIPKRDEAPASRFGGLIKQQ